MKRHHFKTSGLVSSTNPSGRSLLGKAFILRKKYQNGTISEEELMELVQSGLHSDLIVSGKIKIDTPIKEKKFKTITIFGREMKISVEEHSVHSTLICM
jgi:hypothetical protein